MSDETLPSIPWGIVKKKLPRYMHDTEAARDCLLWLWQCGSESARAPLEAKIAELERQYECIVQDKEDAIRHRVAAEAERDELRKRLEEIYAQPMYAVDGNSHLAHANSREAQSWLQMGFPVIELIERPRRPE